MLNHPERSREDLRAGPTWWVRYFGTIGMRMIAGREFTTLDGQDKSARGHHQRRHRETVLSRRESCRQADRVRIDERDAIHSVGLLTGSDFEIVGVVSDAGYESAHQRQRLMYYRPCRQALTRLE